MRESQAQIVLFVRAVEEADREGRILPPDARAAATRDAVRAIGVTDGERVGETVIDRADRLFDTIKQQIPGLSGATRIVEIGFASAPALLLLAFVVGVLTNALGPARRINLLSLPLLGILAWNVAIYVILIARVALGGTRVPSPAFVGRLAERISTSAVGARARTGFLDSWRRLAGPLLLARVQRALHVGAAALVAGAIAGMYLRGIGFEYLATWESTWLSVSQARTLLGIVLEPAAIVLRIQIPDLAPLRGPGGAGDAAPWIHLYAVAALLWVMIPRAVLALVASRRCTVLADLDIDLNDPYFRRIFAEWRGTTRHVEILPYSFVPSAATLSSLQTLLHDYFGARADIRVSDPLDYGDDPIEFAETDRERCLVLLFNLAQSPEAEVHGRFATEFRERLDAGRSGVVAFVDVSGYRNRVADPERRRERFRNWQLVLREAGLAAIEFDPELRIDDDGLELLGAAIG